MMKGHNEHAYWLKETMRLMPEVHQAVRSLYFTELELRQIGLKEKADNFRAVKIQMYDFEMDCRIRNGELIESTLLKSKERKLLRLRFVRGRTWRHLYNSLGYSPDHCKRIHRDGIAKVAKQFADKDFKSEYEREHARLDALLEMIGER